jgi:GH24 family phage-related lysozyme (muramidase)
MDTFYESLSSFFSSPDEAKRVLSSKKSEEVDADLVYDEYEAGLSLKSEPVRTLEMVDDLGEQARRSSEEAALLRQEAGITQSLGPKEASNEAPEVMSLLDTAFDSGSTSKDEEESAPVTAETSGAGSVKRTATEGLMSPDSEEAPVADTSIDDAVSEAMSTDVDTVTAATTNFAKIKKGTTSTDVVSTTALTDGFDSLTASEGTKIHLDGRGFVTLPHGIVPDSNSVKKSDGTAFNPTGSHGLTSSGLSGVDYSGATKYGIKRSSYTSDEDWAKAVYSEFANKAAKKYGTGFSDLTDKAKQAAYDMTWNAGIGAASWSSVKTMLKEASKATNEEKTTANLIGFTTNFKSGTDYPRGLLKRRVQTYNLVAKPGEEASTITTSSIMTDGKRTGTKYEIKKADGTILKTWTKPDNNEKLGNLAVN